MKLEGICPLTTEAALERATAIAPYLEAIVANDARLKFAEFGEEVARIRSALAGSGVKHGDHVGLCLGSNARFSTLFFAIGSLGAVVVPINTRFRADEIAYVLKQARISWLFMADKLLTSNYVEMLRPICPQLDSGQRCEQFPDLETITVIGDDVPEGALSWDEFIARAGVAVEARCQPEDVLLIQYTSGSTSFPKGCLLTHRGMLANAFFAGGRVGFRTGDRYHSARPFFHVAGTVLSILGAMQHVTTLVTMEKFEPGEALRLLEEERCTHFSGNDTMVIMMLNHPDRAFRKLNLRGGWASATPSVMKRLMDEFGARQVVTTYGLSEASPNVAISCWWEPEEIRAQSKVLPQPGVEVRIRNLETGAICAANTAGEIQVRGWSVMLGYYDRPEETAKTIDPEGWLSTGDIGILDENGRLQFVGRAKEILRVGGENVSPLEVEDILHRHPKVRFAQIAGVPDERLVEVPAAFIILRDGEICDEQELIAWSKQHMAGFKVPRYVRIISDFESIGMTGSGKVQRKQLAAYATEVLGLVATG
nr:AMP-binding protein [Agrobacterium sp. T29]